MMVTVIGLVVLLISILFIKSTTIILKYGMGKRNSRVNVFVCVLAGVLAFVPIAKWIIMIGTPVSVCVWYCTNGFDEHNLQSVELSEDTFIGKILLFKI